MTELLTLIMRSVYTLAPAALYLLGRLDVNMFNLVLISIVVSSMEGCVLLWHNISTTLKLAKAQSAILPQQHDYIERLQQQHKEREQAFLQALAINEALRQCVQQQYQVNIELEEGMVALDQANNYLRSELARKIIECWRRGVSNAEGVSVLTEDIEHFKKELSRRDLECTKLHLRNARVVAERERVKARLGDQKRQTEILTKKLSLLHTQFSDVTEQLSCAVKDTEEAQAAFAEMKIQKGRDLARLEAEVGGLEETKRQLLAEVEIAQDGARSEREAFRSLHEKTANRIRYLEEKVLAKDGLLASVYQDAKDASAVAAQRDTEIRSLQDQLIGQGLQNLNRKVT
ncbi:hypothetical protein C8Q80DRAFT_1274703 [Daedaleopsis nitida]|nr:hypothetical protein C8Q80DRAFT_1274703 [Daedaleopsis nitida]